VIKASLSDADASSIAEGILTSFTPAEEADGTLDKAIDELAYYLIRAVDDFNEEQKAKAG
jgi:hypothetical protein